MPNLGLSPPLVPFGADQTIYLVVDSVDGRNTTQEIELERADFETVVAALLAGEFSAPIRVIAFNTLEHWNRDISQVVAEEIRTLCDIECNAVPEHLSDFVEYHMAPAPQPVVSPKFWNFC
jgi:hypothetical protein